MKTSKISATIDELCNLFGNTRQAYYQSIRFKEQQAYELEIVLQLVVKIRIKQPRIGGRKLYKLLKGEFVKHEFKIGRDAFFDILGENNLLIKSRKKRRVITTMSFHWLRKYPNLIVNFTATAANQLWVSDITYIETASAIGYLSLITDAYSRKIVGWYLCETLKAEGSIKALNMALRQEELSETLIHHSDRGIQYCSNDYVKILKNNNITISMTENSAPRENAIAERVNGILKDEWFYDFVLKDLKEARIKLEQVVSIYNAERPHMSIDYLTPEQAHNMQGEIKRSWKNYYKQEKSP